MMLAAIKADANNQKVLQGAVRKAPSASSLACRCIPILLFDTVQFFVMVHQLLP